MPSENQLRITVPAWVAKMKGWTKKSNLQVVPLIGKEDLTTKTQFVVKEVPNNEHKKTKRTRR